MTTGDAILKGMNIRLQTLLFILWLLLSAPPMASAMGGSPSPRQCQPTAEDEMGPFYRPGAPIRSRIGQGYLLSGKVLSAADCRPIATARIELWQAGPNGRYDDAHRATLFSDRKGRYAFETDFAPPYFSRPPHIHIRVSAEDFLPLVTQHYLKKETSRGTFDLVLVPAR